MSVPSLPLVLDDSVNQTSKTREAVELLKRFGLWEDVERVQKSYQVRTGRAKVRGKRHRRGRGPLFVVGEGSETLCRALRNIPGVESVNVKRLNISLLAPGGHLGRLTVFTEGALKALNDEFGSFNGSARYRKGYTLRREVVSNPDITSIINSDGVQSVLRDKKVVRALHTRQKKNPLKNKALMEQLNPFQKTLRAKRVKKITKDKKVCDASRTKALKFLAKIEEKIEEKQ